MSLSNENFRDDYTGNGATSVYGYNFKIFSEDDLRVLVQDTNGSISVLTLNTDYTVSGVGEAAGGNITLVDASQSWLDSGNLKSSYLLTIKRQLDFVQETDFINQGAFYPETHEAAFDLATMRDQQLNDLMSRSAKIAETATFDAPSLPTPVAGECLVYDADGNLTTTTNQPGGLSSTDPLVDTVTITSGSADASKHVLTFSDGFITPGLLSKKHYINTRSASGNIGFGADGFILCNTTGGSITLSGANSNDPAGMMYVFKKVTSDFNTVTFDPYASNTIDGASTAVMCATEGEVRAVIKDSSTTWRTVYHYVPDIRQTFTPSWTNVTVGSGTNEGVFWREGKFMAGEVSFTYGSGSAVSGTPIITVPQSLNVDSNYYAASTGNPVGLGGIFDSGTATYEAYVYVASATTIGVVIMQSNGTYGYQNVISSSTPQASWAAGDKIRFNFRIPIAEWDA